MLQNDKPRPMTWWNSKGAKHTQRKNTIFHQVAEM